MSDMWDTYSRRLATSGLTKQDTVRNREKRYLSEKMKDSPSYYKVQIDGRPRHAVITDTETYNTKTICSVPGEKLKWGSLVFWKKCFWIVTDRDSYNELYDKAKLTQCNHLLRWVDEDGSIKEQWCVVEDGTMYTAGETESGDRVATTGNSRIILTVSRNPDTIKFNRQRRFLIDDQGVQNKLAYELSKPVKVGTVWNDDDHGVFTFVLQEVVSTKYDNMDLGIADYYRYYRKDGTARETPIIDFFPADRQELDDKADTERGGWI